MSKSSADTSNKLSASRGTQPATIQSIIFKMPPWNITKALTWLKDNDKLFVKVDVTEMNKEGVSQLRFRQVEPDQFDRFTTETTDKDISFVLGWKDDTGGKISNIARIQAIMFMKPNWTVQTAKKWLIEYGIEPPTQKVIKKIIQFTIIPRDDFNSFSTIKTNNDVDFVLGWSQDQAKTDELVKGGSIEVHPLAKPLFLQTEPFDAPIQSSRVDNIQ